MTPPLNVQPADLRGKAAQLATPLPSTPTAPQPPCGLGVAAVAVRQVCAEAEGLQSFVEAGREEAELLAGALRAAATAYEATDAAGAEALDGTVTGMAQTDVPPSDVSAVTPHMPILACPAPPGYLDLESAARQIAEPDQADTLDKFATAWDTYADKLAARAELFQLDTVRWEGNSAKVAGKALDQHKGWLDDMGDACREMSAHAQQLAQAHRSAVAAHPTLEEVQAVTAQLQLSNFDPVVMERYQALQAESEQALADYARESVLTTVDPPIPPMRRGLGAGGKMGEGLNFGEDKEVPPTPPRENTGGGGSGAEQSGGGAPSPPQPAVHPAAAQTAPQQGGKPPGGGGAPSGGAPSGGGSPSGGGIPGGGLPGGLPAGGLPGGGLPKSELDDPGIGPASTGGGSGGGGAGGGRIPLGPSVGAETVAPGPSGARGGGSGAIPAAAMGGGAGGMGGGMGGGGMGGAGAQQGKDKKRNPLLAPDENLYTEDRPWTEAIIGNRRRKDVQDKDSK